LFALLKENLLDAKIAKELAERIQTYGDGGGSYTVEPSQLKKGQLQDFHRWADDRPCKGAFLIRAPSKAPLWVVVIDWKRLNNYYVVLFPETRTGPLAEIHECVKDEGEYTLRWKYTPRKRDGKNPARLAYFIKAFDSNNVVMSVPRNPAEVEDFFLELFALAISRQKADTLDPVRPPSREGFPEGKLKERLHRARERNPELIRQAKQLALERNEGNLKCVCCAFDFEKTYGVAGKGFIEGHHTKPISTLHEDGELSKVEDIALVCANCHRMLHRRRPWLELARLTDLLNDG